MKKIIMEITKPSKKIKLNSEFQVIYKFRDTFGDTISNFEKIKMLNKTKELAVFSKFGDIEIFDILTTSLKLRLSVN